uniref:Putative secreted protein n=1 Tax=Anopheles triannulatus TaxID=58253 RepID=A0A2M4B0V5_9DIPT
MRRGFRCVFFLLFSTNIDLLLSKQTFIAQSHINLTQQNGRVSITLKAKPPLTNHSVCATKPGTSIRSILSLLSLSPSACQ